MLMNCDADVIKHGSCAVMLPIDRAGLCGEIMEASLWKVVLISNRSLSGMCQDLVSRHRKQPKLHLFELQPCQIHIKSTITMPTI